MSGIKSIISAFMRIEFIVSRLTGSVAFFLLISLTATLKGQDTIPAVKKISLLFMGDIMGHDSQINAAEVPGTGEYDYREVFMHVKPLIGSCDFAAANLEVTLAGPPYKGYPQFSSPAALAAACTDAGIDCLFTANNHSADRGKAGILNTLDRLDSLGIPNTGTFRNLASRDTLQPLVFNMNGTSVAFLNYTYGTNGIRVPPPVIINMLEKESISSDILKAKELNPDILILALHWGTEYDTIPSEDQIQLANYFFYRGVDIIIGSHPHVIQKMIWQKDNPIFKNKAVAYSLGNLISNQRKPKTDGGSIIRVEITKTDNTVMISDAGYYLTWVYTPVENGRMRFYILPCAEYENKPEFFPDRNDYLRMMKYVKSARSLLSKQNEGFRELLPDLRYGN